MNKPLRHQDHPRPVTRRELLAQGFLGFSAVATMPTLAGLMSTRAFAMDCGGPVESYLPFMVFDMAGGAALPANFLVGGQGGPQDLLMNYNLLGWDPRASASLDMRFGIPMAASYSTLLAGILQTASAPAQANLRMGSFAHFARDDTSGNQLSAVSLVARTGYRGLIVPKGVGTRSSDSGGNSDVVGRDPALRPLAVTRVADILNSVSFGAAFTGLNAAAITAMARGAMNVGSDQLSRLPAGSDTDTLSELARCGYEQNLGYTQGTAGLDPRNNAQMRAIYQIAQNTADNTEDVVAAAIAMNVMTGNSGPGIFTLGGCDYHDGTQTTGDAKDLSMGRQIGRAVEVAHQTRKPLFFQLLTDGGTYAREGTRMWRGDAGDKCMTVIGFYDPNGPREMRRQQVGWYTNGQGAEQNTFIGSEPAKVACAVFANYLNVTGRLGDFERYAPGVFSTRELDESLIFA